jgi:hypothetical protein
MSRHPLRPVIFLVLLLLASGCSSPVSLTGTRVATCTVALDAVDGAENAKAGDYVANLGRGTLVHLDAIDESAEGVMAGSGGGRPAFSGNRKDARIRSIGGGRIELDVLDPDTAAYLANSPLCRP